MKIGLNLEFDSTSKRFFHTSYLLGLTMASLFLLLAQPPVYSTNREPFKEICHELDIDEPGR